MYDEENEDEEDSDDGGMDEIIQEGIMDMVEQVRAGSKGSVQPTICAWQARLRYESGDLRPGAGDFRPPHQYQYTPVQGDLASELGSKVHAVSPRWAPDKVRLRGIAHRIMMINCHSQVPSTLHMLLRDRSAGAWQPKLRGWSSAQQRHVACLPALLPCEPVRIVDSMDARAYIGQFSADGTRLVGAHASTKAC